VHGDPADAATVGSDTDAAAVGSDTDAAAVGSDTDGPAVGSDTDGPAVGSDTDGPPRALVIAALALAVLGLGAILTLAAMRRPRVPPVAIAAVPAPAAQAPQCQALLAALPDSLGDLPRAETAQPTPAGTAAWRGDGDPVILRCGLDRPAEFVVGAPLQMVGDVSWFRLDDADTRRSTWVSVDRSVYIALTLPADSGPTPIQTMSEAIARAMPVLPIRPGPPA
jgi:hypothetical protein